MQRNGRNHSSKIKIVTAAVAGAPQPQRAHRQPRSWTAALTAGSVRRSSRSDCPPGVRATAPPTSATTLAAPRKRGLAALQRQAVRGCRQPLAAKPPHLAWPEAPPAPPPVHHPLPPLRVVQELLRQLPLRQLARQQLLLERWEARELQVAREAISAPLLSRTPTAASPAPSRLPQLAQTGPQALRPLHL